jgi:hypothetical protein
MKKKLPIIPVLIFLPGIFFTSSPVAAEDRTYPPFGCYENYYCYSSGATGSCKATKANPYDSRPAPTQCCFDDDYMHATHSCASNFRVYKKYRYYKYEGGEAGCMNETWEVWPKWILTNSTLPFLGKSGQENASVYVDDWLEGDEIYKRYEGSLAREHAGVINKLSPQVNRYLYTNPTDAWGMCEAHDYVVDTGQKKIAFSEGMHDAWGQGGIGPPKITDPTLSQWLKTEYPIYYSEPYMPTVTREDALGWFCPTAGIIDNGDFICEPGEDCFDIINATYYPEAHPELSHFCIKVSIPHILRLGSLTGIIQRKLIPFLDINYWPEEAGGSSLEPATPLSNQPANASETIGEKNTNPPAGTSLILNSGGVSILTAQKTVSETKSQVLQAQTSSCNVTIPPALPTCNHGGATDNKPNDRLCCGDSCNADNTTIVGHLIAKDSWVNEYWDACHWVQLTGDICNSCSIITPPPCACPGSTCWASSHCQSNPSDCRWEVHEGECKLVYGDCTSEVEHEVYREFGANALWNYFASTWQHFAAEKITQVYPRSAFANIFRSASTPPFPRSDAATQIAFGCDGCDRVEPGGGLLSFPILGGFEEARKRIVQMLTSAHVQPGL